MCTGYVAALNDIVLFYTDTQILADTEDTRVDWLQPNLLKWPDFI